MLHLIDKRTDIASLVEQDLLCLGIKVYSLRLIHLFSCLIDQCIELLVRPACRDIAG